jgi:hypothetical protein
LILPTHCRALGCTCVLQDALFVQSTPDAVWLSEVGERGWTVLAKVNESDIDLKNSRTPGLAQRGVAILAQDYSFAASPMIGIKLDG